MNRFNLNDLRADAECYAPGHHRDDHAIIIDLLVEALIGSTEYQLLSDYPYARVQFIPADQDTTLTLSLS